LAGGIERRAATGELARLGGMARGRPALATVLMTTGIIALAVPGSTAFAGEFAILAGVFRTSWAWAVIGAIAIVLAAMYMLRLISAVLHETPGPAVSLAALDLRPAELGVLVPLVGCLLFLSAWPAAITDRAFAQRAVVDQRLLRQALSDQCTGTLTVAEQRVLRSVGIKPQTGAIRLCGYLAVELDRPTFISVLP
jgi:NADH:ubiquinone oxidoreductase subunit 4 (subunit M)